MKTIAAFLLVGLASLQAGEFINLDFNNPDLRGPFVPTYDGGPVVGLASRIVRGWTITADGKDVTDATYSRSSQGSGITVVTLRQADSSFDYGNYLLLSSDRSITGKSGPDIWLSQTGLIPSDAQGLRVLGDSAIEGYINGNKIGSLAGGIVGGPIWDVSAYRGQVVNLQIHSFPNEINRFDIVGFTTVPEPTAVAMLALGLGLIGWQAGRRN